MPLPRMRALELAEMQADARDVLEGLRRERGNLPNMFRTYARRPAIMQAMVALMDAALKEGTAPAALKELLAVRVSGLNACTY